MRVRAGVLVAACLSVAACGKGDAPKSTPHADGMAMDAAPGDSAATRGYRESMAGMMKASPAYSGDADVDFNRQMLVHHQAAVAMAEVELAHGRDPESLALARAVIKAQRAEIEAITAWLAKHPVR
ncbi:DUF305 domain-containing protein [Sphingomonas prati]|uniref:Uncharacterized protein (DUF305 family) n=1 Tax=Sphingomonas prati TaxID=1843237 RepID=A0A7W9BSV3_9SPHN|nr:DUF305 domain-containing protein [Sphingomonas prati]MBB5729495.1 uncharacterized protein (DUF305 family) [Sphingomonas prati]GGE76978.1 hypothetical protein GCM10011404_07090 [Sphingomonas prati]